MNKNPADSSGVVCPPRTEIVARDPFDDPVPSVSRPITSNASMRTPEMMFTSGGMGMTRAPYMSMAPHYPYPQPPAYHMHPHMHGMMPFSPPTIQHPNAPPIHICGGCRMEIRDDDKEAIHCSVPGGCRFFYHYACAGLTPAAFSLLNSEPYAEWVCNACYSSKQIELVQYPC